MRASSSVTVSSESRTQPFSPQLTRFPFESLLQATILTSNIRAHHALLSAPMKTNRRRSVEETWRSRRLERTFANRLSRFKGAVTLATRSFRYS